MKNINALARQEIVDMVPYQSARRLEAGNGEFNSKIWLNANEASGPGIYSINGDCINRYPDFQPNNLIDAYSQYSGLNNENILATRGADEGIELIIRTFCRAYQDNILICPPTYGMYAISAENHGAGIVKVPLVEQQLDITALEQQVGKVNVVFLCSPGNPTGNLLNKDDIIRTIELFADTAIVVVDEAYIEFSPQNTAANLLAKYPHVVVLRTLSKAFALAGLRCGFTLANTDIITLLSKVIAPYPVPAPIAEIASEVLSNKGLEQVKVRVQETIIQRNSLTSWLNEQTWCKAVFNSDANFVLFRCTDEKTKNSIFTILAEQGILIRDQSKQMQLAHCLRISIGSERELTVLKQTLATFTPSQAFNEVVE
ncbi:histidinol-phosphate transaminase [Thalassotalea sp. 1_MG-2023]|uniref:histidinol-phosphate transaminase n=1 Tax=Thalassotalea sp. 1_MG-2023 TaxID=3062680 RepID=UPI0026E45C75|nr:histidinol-phosphate transaminase [Thalassotalea sp. 1_MG-2023]MDO6427863.1 histidinol-phosphate transaminase [Thalassotalea sp. 1_MG-2023]